MSRRLWIDTRGQPVITSTRNGEQNAKRWGWTEAVAVTAADRPSVTDNARAVFEAEGRYSADTALSRMRREAFINGAEWAAGRAETTTEGTQPGCTGAGDCPAPAHLHGCFADTEGHCNDPDDHPAETTTATTEDAAQVISDYLASFTLNRDAAEHHGPRIVQALASAGLLATARTRPTRDDLARAIASGYETDHPTPNRHDYRAADAVLALWADQPTEAD